MAILGRAGLAGAAALLATVALVPLLRSPSGGDTVAPATTTMAAAEPVAAVPGVVVPAPITAPAAVTVPADRLEGPQPVSTCQQIAYNVAKANPGTTQVIVVLTATAASTTGTLQVADLGAQGWQCGAAMTARVGRSGVRPLLDRRSGDGTTPAGVFPLGRMTAWDGQQFSFFGNAADPGVSAGPYRRVQYGDCFGATPNHPDYGHLVYRTPGNCTGPDDEYLPAITGAYVHAALIGANMEPDVSGDAPGETPYAAAIFLHRHSYDGNGASKPTSGCVSLSQTNLVSVLRAMRPGVMFAIGQTDWLLANT